LQWKSAQIFDLTYPGSEMSRMVKTERKRDHICYSLPQSSVSTPRAPEGFHEGETLLVEKMAVGSRRVARHATLYRKDDSLTALYLVRFGQFKLIDGELNDERVAGLPMAGDLLGMDAIATGRHTLGAIALESSEVYEIPFPVIVKTMSVEPAFQRQFLQIMGQAINAECSQSRLLGSTTLDQRFATFLLQLSEKYACLGYSDKSYRLSIPRGDIGSYLGTSAESISRLIAGLNAQQAVSIHGRLVELRDRAFLQSLACGDEPSVMRRIGDSRKAAK
jgi:CRP/FNR family transcriptional regulator